MIDESRGVLQFADNRPSLSEVGHQGTLRYREASGFPFPRSGRAPKRRGAAASGAGFGARGFFLSRRGLPGRPTPALAVLNLSLSIMPTSGLCRVGVILSTQHPR
jgi:hypothetical protein